MYVNAFGRCCEAVRAAIPVRVYTCVRVCVSACVCACVCVYVCMLCLCNIFYIDLYDGISVFVYIV